MLTESEREWLRNRKRKDDLYFFCKYCVISPKTDDCYWNHVTEQCPMYPDLKDALEFSERVAAELAGMMLKPNRYPCRGGFPPLGCMRDWSNLTGPMAVHCEDCILREVRLQVEEEMDNEP